MTTSGSSDARVLLELAERVEAATGPDRDLDCAIFCATAASPFDNYFPDCILASMGGFSARVEISEIAHYTSSIDVAMSLVPEGFVANIGNDVPCWAHIWIDKDFDGRPQSGFAKTMQNALCAAALRGKAALAEQKSTAGGE